MAKTKEQIEKHFKRLKAKRESTMKVAIEKVKAQARQDTWCSTHANCFRWYEGETESHIRKKFEQFLEWRKFGATVFTELILKNKKRPDLVICLNNGEVFVEEIVESETEASLAAKDSSYPFPIKVISTDRFSCMHIKNGVCRIFNHPIENGYASRLHCSRCKYFKQTKS